MSSPFFSTHVVSLSLFLSLFLSFFLSFFLSLSLSLSLYLSFFLSFILSFFPFFFHSLTSHTDEELPVRRMMQACLSQFISFGLGSSK